MVISSINYKINYNETRYIDQDDIDYETNIFKGDLHGKNISFVLGKPKFDYITNNIVYFYVYLVKNTKELVKIGLYEKAFYKWLSDNVVSPTKEEVSFYFKENYEGGSLDEAYKSIETILVQQKQKNSKLLYETSIKNRDDIRINEGWFNE